MAHTNIEEGLTQQVGTVEEGGRGHKVLAGCQKNGRNNMPAANATVVTEFLDLMATATGTGKETGQQPKAGRDAQVR